jgi:hypothetical protein
MLPPELTSFYKATQELLEAMKSDLPLDALDLVRLEDSIALLQMKYLEWKRRHFSAH